MPEDLQRASSLSLLALDAGGNFVPPQLALPLDRRPDGLRVSGGAQPAALVAMRTKPYVFVAMSNVDRVAAVSLEGAPIVAGGTELRLFDRGPYGTQPSALVLSKDEKRLYVALAGINAVAVLDASDPRHLHRLGLIPTGWYPVALALSHDGRTLFVVDAKGIGQDRGFAGDRPSVLSARGNVLEVAGDAGAIWSTLERIDLGTVDLRVSTARALADQRAVKAARHDAIVPLLGTARSHAIRHVVVIVEAGKTTTRCSAISPTRRARRTVPAIRGWSHTIAASRRTFMRSRKPSAWPETFTPTRGAASRRRSSPRPGSRPCSPSASLLKPAAAGSGSAGSRRLPARRVHL